LGAAGLTVVAALNSHARTLGHPSLGVTSVALHLVAVSLWVGGLGALVVLGGMSWRAVERERRPSLLRAVIPRFSRIAIVAVLVVIATGTVNAILDLAKVSDLWSTTYGKVVLAKVGLLGLALLLAARHLWLTPRRLATPEKADNEARSFERSSAAELVLLGVAIALASALVALVPGKTLALAANGPVSKEQAAGPYTVQLFIDQTAVPNEVHATFVNSQGLAAAEVTNIDASIARAGAPAAPLEMRLISSGHFVADAGALQPGRYRIDVHAHGAVDVSTTFNVKLSSKGNQ
jgi:copper transport protein